MTNIEIIETDTVPKCPYCEKPLTSIELNSQGNIFCTNIYIFVHIVKNYWVSGKAIFSNLPKITTQSFEKILV